LPADRARHAHLKTRRRLVAQQSFGDGGADTLAKVD
jgi:hypothetical protein